MENYASKEGDSVEIASNVSFSGWTTIPTDPRLCTVDRLKFGGNIKITITHYRFAHSRAHRAAAT